MLAAYIVYFERIVAANEWSDEVAARVFPCLLEVGSQHLDFESMSDANPKKFSLIKQTLVGTSEPYREAYCEIMLKGIESMEKVCKIFMTESVG